MGLFSFLGVLSPAHISLFTLFSRGRKIGRDSLGNTYFESAARKGYKHTRRWVIYKGAPDASKVPAEWHGWLHHQTDAIPSESAESFRRPWQRTHIPNLTGTNMAYRPPGHILQGGVREKATGDYQPWIPPQ